jgi:hypothetical protein
VAKAAHQLDDNPVEATRMRDARDVALSDLKADRMTRRRSGESVSDCLRIEGVNVAKG